MDETLTRLLEQVAAHCLKNQFRLATAESCTGGGIAFYATALPGSSAWFERGFVTYSNESKAELLDIPLESIESWGAVSENTARAMAQGALKNSHADMAIAVTGIAGPGGATPDKPVGTVWFAWAHEGVVMAQKKQFQGNREQIRQEAIVYALQEVLNKALEKK